MTRWKPGWSFSLEEPQPLTTEQIGALEALEKLRQPAPLDPNASTRPAAELGSLLAAAFTSGLGDHQIAAAAGLPLERVRALRHASGY